MGLMWWSQPYLGSCYSSSMVDNGLGTLAVCAKCLSTIPSVVFGNHWKVCVLQIENYSSSHGAAWLGQRIPRSTLFWVMCVCVCVCMSGVCACVYLRMCGHMCACRCLCACEGLTLTSGICLDFSSTRFIWCRVLWSAQLRDWPNCGHGGMKKQQTHIQKSCNQAGHVLW